MTDGRAGAATGGDGEAEVGEEEDGEEVILRTLGTSGSKLEGWRPRLS